MKDESTTKEEKEWKEAMCAERAARERFRNTEYHKLCDLFSAYKVVQNAEEETQRRREIYFESLDDDVYKCLLRDSSEPKAFIRIGVGDTTVQIVDALLDCLSANGVRIVGQDASGPYWKLYLEGGSVEEGKEYTVRFHTDNGAISRTEFAEL